MKILNSKKKDFFHYLQGVLGMDDKVVLDYTETYLQQYTPAEYTVKQIWIAGWLIETIYIDDEWRYGEELLEYSKDQSNNKYFKKANYYLIYDISEKYHCYVLKEPTYFEESPNDFYECAIMLFYKTYSEKHWKEKIYYKFPILKEYNFNKVWDEYKVWNVLYDWLSKDKEFIDNRTDKEKILNNGFNLKESFRNVK